jgi:hypothetical protein
LIVQLASAASQRATPSAPVLSSVRATTVWKSYRKGELSTPEQRPRHLRSSLSHWTLSCAQAVAS